MQQKDRVPYKGTWTSLRSRTMGTSWSTVKYRQGNAKDEHRLWEEPIASNIVKEDLGVRVDEKLDLSQQCAPTAQKAKHTLSWIQSSVASKSREGILPLYSTSMRPHLECCIHFQGPQHKKDLDQQKQFQRMPQRWPEGFKNSPRKIGWELGLFSLQKRRVWGNLIVAFKYLNRALKKGGEQLRT